MNIKWINAKDDAFEAVKQIRRAVFTAEQGASFDEEFDSYDNEDGTVYVLLLDGETPLATGRLARPDGAFKIGRIAVVRAFRGQHLGETVVLSLCEKAWAQGAEFVLVDAQCPAVGFYERLGFYRLSDEIITDRGLPHLPMRKDH